MIICQYCNNSFSSKSNLNMHQKRTRYCLKLQPTTSVEIFLCEYCDKQFTRKDTFNRQEQVCVETKMKFLVNRVTELEKELDIYKEKYQIYKELYKKKDIDITEIAK